MTADGGAGINFEHSAIDGHTALRFVSDIYADTVISFAQSITKLVHAHQAIPSVITANVRRAAVTLDNQGRTTLNGGCLVVDFLVDLMFSPFSVLAFDKARLFWFSHQLLLVFVAALLVT